MTRALFVTMALLLAADARAADQKPADAKPAASAASGAKAKADELKKKKEAEEAARSGAKSAPKQPKDTPKVAAMKQARAKLIYAADTCQNPSKCEKELRDDFVEGFISACRECDTVDRCEAEKQAILDGNVPRGGDLCARPQK
jgi:hypothetical protein